MIFFICYIFFNFLSINANEIIHLPYQQKNISSDLKVSLIVPCYFKHAYLLYDLLKIYEKQTVAPDEVVISLSGVGYVDPLIIEKLKSTEWIFPTKLILSRDLLFAGPSRNKACQEATGDILLCQDADDIPHPQRVEIIKYFFEKYNLDHLMHLFRTVVQSFPDYDPATINFMQPASFKEAWLPSVHHGNIAIAKHVFNSIKWSNMRRGQDVDFNRRVYSKFKKCMILKVPLLIYRRQLSSTLKDYILRTLIYCCKKIKEVCLPTKKTNYTSHNDL